MIQEAYVVKLFYGVSFALNIMLKLGSIIFGLCDYLYFMNRSMSHIQSFNQFWWHFGRH